MSRDQPSQQKRTCKIVQESCKNLACKTCLTRARDMSLFLHDSCNNSCKILQKMQVIILAATLAKSCTISCKICARLCKNRARKGTYRVHVPSKSCMQDSCTILHDLASSFLLGYLAAIGSTTSSWTSHNYTISRQTPTKRISRASLTATPICFKRVLGRYQVRKRRSTSTTTR